VIVREAGGVVQFVDAPEDWLRADSLITFAGDPALVAEAVEIYHSEKARNSG